MLELPAPPVLLVDLLQAELVAADLATTVEQAGDRVLLADLDEQHRTAATAVLTAHPANAQARIDEGASMRANEATIQQRATDALATNATFLAIASPTNAQTLAQVKALTRQTNGIIRLVLRRFEAAD